MVFLTLPGAVNVVKACQGWVLAADDDDGEEMDKQLKSAMLPIFMHSAPILQNVPGSHWAFVFDVLEAVLEVIGLGTLTSDLKKRLLDDLCQILRMYLLYLVPHVVNLCCQSYSTFRRWSIRMRFQRCAYV